MNIMQRSSSITSTQEKANYRGGRRGMAWVLQQPGNAEEKGGAGAQKTQTNENSMNV